MTAKEFLKDKKTPKCFPTVRAGWVALMDEYAAEIKAKNASLRSALQYLYDEQNGAPLVRREKQWQAAMNEAEKLLKQ